VLTSPLKDAPAQQLEVIQQGIVTKLIILVSLQQEHMES
jgi:hypothetical protein